MKLKCTKCGHVWTTRKERIPPSCPHCKYSTYYHKPIPLVK